MHLSLLQIIEKTTHQIKDHVEGVDSKVILKELIQILFDQCKEVSEAHKTFLKYVDNASKAHRIDVNSYDVQFYWSQVQNVVSKSSDCLFLSLLSHINSIPAPIISDRLFGHSKYVR